MIFSVYICIFVCVIDRLSMNQILSVICFNEMMEAFIAWTGDETAYDYLEGMENWKKK